MSYIFRIAPAQWADGSKVTAEQVARALRRQIQGSSRNPLRDPLGAVSEIVAMTERVIEIRLSAPRPNLLSLLAQPELAIVRNGARHRPVTGSRAMRPAARSGSSGTIEDLETDETREEQVLLSGKPAGEAVSDFIAGKADLVLGGTFADLPIARQVSEPAQRASLRSRLGPVRAGPGRRAAGRSRATNGAACSIGRSTATRSSPSLAVPGLTPRATLLEPGLDGVPAPAAPQWAAEPVAERRGSLAARGAEADRKAERAARKSASSCPRASAPTCCCASSSSTGPTSASRSCGRAMPEPPTSS